MIEKLVQVGYLFDFYGQLLSERQYMVIEMFYIKDLSLSEIGEILGITRQGVHDNLKRAEDNLFNYEKELKLCEKFNNRNDNLKEILDMINEIKKLDLDIDVDNKIEDIEKIVLDILKDSWEGVD